MEDTREKDGKTQERNAFLFITIILFPLLSSLLVSVMGFSIWISQMIFGPPSV